MPRKVMIGADPEFEVRDHKGEFISADDAIEDTSNEFGTDGCSDTGEIRPKPGTPEDVVKNISNILTKGNKKVGNEVNLFAGAYKNVPLGGHIHFSGVENNSSFIKSLDILITKPLRKVSNARRRINAGYGGMSEYNLNNHGWEYRAPCSWISHPIITEGVLQIAYYCAIQFNKSQKLFTSVEELLNDVSGEVGDKIKKFYAVIDKMIAKKIKLEEIEIFQAWRKRPLIEIDKSEFPKIKVNFTFNAKDFNITPIKNSYTKAKIKTEKYVGNVDFKISGARRNRSGINEIFVPYSLSNDLPKTILKVKISYWNRNAIGLSYTLREDVSKSVKVIKALDWHFTNHAKHKKGDLINLADSKVILEIEN
jgi:hypothetical protein